MSDTLPVGQRAAHIGEHGAHRRLHALPGRAVSERRWLATFLRLRRAVLLHPHNRARRVDWPESAGRVDALASLLRDGHTDLTPPLRVNPWNDAKPFVLR